MFDRYDPPPCDLCHGDAPQWVRWMNATGHTFLFCDNDCLLAWLKHQCGVVIDEIEDELREVATDMWRRGETLTETQRRYVSEE